MAEAFKVNSSHVAGDPDSLIDIFKSLEANKQCEASKSDVGPRPDSVEASGAFPAHDHPDHAKNHSEASNSVVSSRLPFFSALALG